MNGKTSDQTTGKKHPKPHTSRQDRLKAALKANMGRRKAQARARKSSSDTNHKNN